MGVAHGVNYFSGRGGGYIYFYFVEKRIDMKLGKKGPRHAGKKKTIVTKRKESHPSRASGTRKAGVEGNDIPFGPDPPGPKPKWNVYGVKGDTWPHKDLIRSLGFRWLSKAPDPALWSGWRLVVRIQDDRRAEERYQHFLDVLLPMFLTPTFCRLTEEEKVKFFGE